MKIKEKKFQAFNNLFYVQLAAPKTIWWFNQKTDAQNITRRDQLVGLTRIYSRNDRHYMWEVHLGRLSFAWSKML